MPQLDLTLFSGHLLTLSLTLVVFYYASYQFFLPGLFKVFFLQSNLFGIPSELLPGRPPVNQRPPAAPGAIVASPESIFFWALARLSSGRGLRLGPGLFLNLRLRGTAMLLAARIDRLVELKRYRLCCLRSYAVLLGFWNLSSSASEPTGIEGNSPFSTTITDE